MKKWFSGKRGGFIAFLAIAGLVAGGLGWVTHAVLELEQEQTVAVARDQLHTRLRLALWRLDSFMIPELAREASRPFAHYSAIYVPYPTLDPSGRRLPPGTCYELSPLLNADLPDWMLLHFSTSAEGAWWSPQVLSDALRQRLGKVAEIGKKNDAQKIGLMQELSKNVCSTDLLSCVRTQEGNQLIQPGISADDVANTIKNTAVLPQSITRQSNNDFMNRREIFNYGGNQSQAPQMNPAGNAYYGGLGPIGENLGALLDKNKNPGQVIKGKGDPVATGPMTAFWITTSPNRERLMVARQVKVGSKQACQGIVLNWQALHKRLKSVIENLFPDAELCPMREATPPNPERTMSALPVELVTTPVELPEPGWTPLRIGLALAWAAALIALSAVGLGGWSLIDLSQRRIRFVSAVTHELRTPLTTLRLYLDMLTGGIVKDAQQREEYLQTLNSETDRLNRLVGNVLDFSRLENQRPRLETSTVKVDELLGQLCANWERRAKECGKEFVVENSAGPDAVCVTDVKMVQQVLGNLIDNACKYSRAAADPRIWLRARCEKKHVVFEVEDRGPGIPNTERRSIFCPFRRGKDADVTAGGVGLGLALAQRWAKLLGGSLDMQPAKDGACFRLELPA